MNLRMVSQRSAESQHLLVTIASFREPWEAHMLRGRLEAEGILATVAHEHHVRQNWSWSTALGGVKVQVPQSAGDAAREIEKLCREGGLEAEPKPMAPGIDELRCQICGSNQFSKRRPVMEIAVTVVLSLSMGIVIPPWTWIHYCKGCGERLKS